MEPSPNGDQGWDVGPEQTTDTEPSSAKHVYKDSCSNIFDVDALSVNDIYNRDLRASTAGFALSADSPSSQPIQFQDMADRLCRPCRDVARRQLRLLRELNRAPTVSQRATVAEIARASTRQFHQTAPSRSQGSPQSEKQPGIAQTLLGIASKLLPSKAVQPYQIFGATESIYKACAAPATYKIPPELRKKEEVTLAENGEEVGVGGGVWHDEFGLPPTFSTWSQVTMLHLYLIVVRLRCLEKNAWQAWQNQLVNHFFHNAEDVMEVNHGMSSRMIRQRHLQNLFQTWRGVILAYDEGLVKGDAVMASAVWRNIFKADENVDMRHVAAIVSWMRSVSRSLDKMLDPALLYHGGSVFKTQPTAELKLVDEPASLEQITKGAASEAQPAKAKPSSRFK
ncbi:ubiquinol cytochrome-c reductase assembly protein Cbp3 [Diaporthe amygdali]|uniref:ubiquinol cytochrome-c reductase assembly protein Cbp3 n=1 Tax=Phomopsis amygdali TaxID=1214568 RepID=UPI0022FF00B8|nr:ubiquinol cytochrome-c reductase assembly protein Cbp3 [Diaporthe amygdali]KAJ0108606.1 ubiquinol cytochrome-c reductase assembly protein Cbp3 [Diaporthe amygdali]